MSSAAAAREMLSAVLLRFESPAEAPSLCTRTSKASERSGARYNCPLGATVLISGSNDWFWPLRDAHLFVPPGSRDNPLVGPLLGNHNKFADLDQNRIVDKYSAMLLECNHGKWGLSSGNWVCEELTL